MLGTLPGSATILPRFEGAADECFPRAGQRLTQPSAVYAPVFALLPHNPTDGEVVTVVGTIVLCRSTVVEFVV